MQSLRTLHPCAPALCILLSAYALDAVPPAGTAWVPMPEATDEFDGATLDTAKWQDFHSYWTGRAPSYFYRPNVSVEGGNLRLKTTPDPLHADSIRAACVQSRARSLAYGYYEARIKASDISMTSSFWFQGKYSEMDVIENIGNPTKAGEEQVAYRMNMNTHYYPNGWETDEANPKYHTLPTRVADAYHIYAAPVRGRLDQRSSFTMSRTARSRPVSTARPTMEWPMLSSQMPLISAMGPTFR